eukprot:TRINITY_DN4344_c0_g2_i2.p2 TRINITY_DN4344_c0_g2~~TRINITY_DN4344_c0_g2_i2.p2  ORF type:complete len:120 (-),score=21.98 TRINITY_DN4344_c0_g2_i2:631-990(-)
MMNATVKSWVYGMLAVFAVVMMGMWIHRLRAENAGLEAHIIGLEELYNRHTPILNEEKFVLEKDFVPIVVYVHQRPHYYQQVGMGSIPFFHHMVLSVPVFFFCFLHSSFLLSSWQRCCE